MIESPTSLSREYHVTLEPVDGSGSSLEISIRETVLEQIPLTLMYDVTGGSASIDGITAEWSAGTLHSDLVDAQFQFNSNRNRVDVLAIFSFQGEEYRWQRDDLDLPFYAGDPIYCNALLLGVPENKIASVQWTARDHFGDDAMRFSAHSGIVTTALSEDYNSAFIECRIEKTSGEIVVTEFPILIYKPSGAVFGNGGFAGTFFEPYDGAVLTTIVNEIFQTMTDISASTLVTAINGYYGCPDSKGIFVVEEINWDGLESPDPRGYTVQEFQLQALFDKARSEGKMVEIEMRTFPHQDDPTMWEEYQPTGGGTYAGFKMTPGFIEGKGGKGLRAFFLNHVDIFVANQDVIAMVYLGVETSDVETMGGAGARSFFQEIIEEYRMLGFGSGLSHATGGHWDTPWHWERVTDPDICGFPWVLSDGPAITSYVGLAFSELEQPSKDTMRERAEHFIGTYVYPFYEAVPGGLAIEDMYCFHTERCLFDPVGNWRGATRNNDLAMQWHLIWGEAYSNDEAERDKNWIRLFSFGEYRMMPNNWINPPLPEWAVKKAYLNPGYDHEDYRAIVSLLFRDLPRAIFGIGPKI